MVFVRNDSQDTNLNECVIQQAVLATLRMHDSEAFEISVLLTNDSAIQSLNRQYRNIDTPTDVLAFAMHEDGTEPMNSPLLGDVVISVPTAQRQAHAHNHSLDVENCHSHRTWCPSPSRFRPPHPRGCYHHV